MININYNADGDTRAIAAAHIGTWIRCVPCDTATGELTARICTGTAENGIALSGYTLSARCPKCHDYSSIFYGWYPESVPDLISSMSIRTAIKHNIHKLNKEAQNEQD